MCATYRLNHPDTTVFEISCGLFLQQIEQWTAMADNFRTRSCSEWTAVLGRTRCELKNHMVLDGSAEVTGQGGHDSDDDFQDDAATCWQIVRIDEVSARTRPHLKPQAIKKDGTEVHTFEYKCRLRRPGGGAELTAWVDLGSTLRFTTKKKKDFWSGCVSSSCVSVFIVLRSTPPTCCRLQLFMAEFVCRCRDTLPLPGNVHLINGGPPCQVACSSSPTHTVLYRPASQTPHLSAVPGVFWP